MQTGRLFTGGIEHPHVGCVLSYLKGQRGDLPAHVLLPRPIGRTGGNMPHGQNAGYLGKSADPFVLNADPADPKFKVPDLLPPEYISAVRAERRQKMRAAVEDSYAAFEQNAQAKQLDDNFNLAYRLMTSPQAASPSISTMSQLLCATAMAARASGKAVCWPAGSSKRASALLR